MENTEPTPNPTPENSSNSNKVSKSRPWWLISLGGNLLLILCIWLSYAYYKSDYRSELKEMKEEHYQQKTEHFKTLPNHRKEIVFLGSSLIAEGLWAEMLGNKFVKNRGIVGDDTKGVLQRLAEVSESKPAKIFILLGKEDLQAKRPALEIMQDYQSILTFISVKSPDTKLYLFGIPPVNPSQGQISPKNDDIQDLNKKIEAIATEFRATYIDLYEVLSSDGVLSTEYSQDGLHLNGTAYQQWQKELKPFLK